MLNIFLTDLASYTKGFLYGNWINLPCDNLEEEVDKVLRGGEAICAIEYGYEKHEEHFITDWEWEDIELFDIDEYHNIFKLNEQLQKLEQYNLCTLKSIAFLLNEYIANDIDDAIIKSDDVIIHEGTTMSGLAYDLMQELYPLDNLPSIISCHIDYDAIARDLEYDGRYFAINNDIYEYCA